MTMTRISISINASHRDKPEWSKNYSVSFNGDFTKVRAEVDKIYEKFKTEEVKSE